MFLNNSTKNIFIKLSSQKSDYDHVKPNECEKKPNVSMTKLKVKPAVMVPDVSTDCSE